MTTILLLKIALGLASTPSVLVVFRALAKRIGTIPKRAASETDYLRAEVKREREEAAIALRAQKAEHDAEMGERSHEIVRLQHRIDALTNEVDGLQGALAETRHDLKTAGRFVDAAITVKRGDKR